MSKRTLFSFLFFLTLPLFAAITYNANIISPIIVKAPKKKLSTTTSGPNHFINQQQISESGATNITEALQSLGGLQLNDLVGGSNQVAISMRGFGANASSNTLLLVNGIPLTNPDIAPPDLNVVPVSEIKFIQIVSGSESVLYGDQAVGGVINIITDEKMPNQINLLCTTGSFNQKNCEAAFSKNWQRFYWHSNLKLFHTNNYRDHNQYDQQLFSGNSRYDYIHGDIIFDYQFAHENLQYPGPLTAAEVREDREAASNHTDFFRDWNDDLKLRHQQKLAENWEIITDLSRREMHGSGVLFSPFDQNRTINFLKPQIKGLIGNVVMTAGIDVEHDDYDLTTSFGPIKNQVTKYSLYNLFNVPLTSKIMTSLGARSALQTSDLQTNSTINTINRAFATTIGMTYQHDNATQFYLREAGSYRFPKADELTSTKSGVGPLFTQRGNAYETGFKINHATYVVQFNLYQLFLRDEIAFDPLQTPEQPFGSNQNLAPTKRTGFSLSSKKNLTEQLTIDGQYNYVNARFQNGIFSGKRIPLVSENIIRAGINYHFLEYWHVYFESIFTGNQFAATDNANVTSPNGGYTIYNFNIGYHRKQFTMGLHINNLFNKFYYVYTVFQSGTQTEFFYPAPERNVTLTIRYDFL